MKKFRGVLALVCLMTILVAGCGKKPEPVKEPEATVTPTAAPTQTPVPTPTEAVVEPEIVETEPIPEGMAKSYLTGEYVSPEIGQRRPLAVMINNVKAAIPSSGLSRAGIIYEAPVEGALTRLMPVFEDYDGMEKIGSVRSCRDYFINYAMGLDAIYVHFGQSVYSLPYLESPDIQNISGLASYGDSIFYRTEDRPSPHNVYISGEGLKTAIEINGYSQEYPSDFKPQFTFAWVGEQVQLESGAPANVVRPGYEFNAPWFEYRPQEGLYYRYEYEGPQMDEVYDTQLAVKNIILQYSAWENYDENGYLKIHADSGGPCKYITNGKVMDGTWLRDGQWGPEKYFDASGNEIVLNTGKTWVCVVLDTYADRVQITEE